MDSAMVMERMYYIIDGNGNYYRTNDEDQLIVSQGKDNADLFELKDANKRINSGRKMYFYSILPADTGKTLVQETPTYEYDLNQLDWKEYLLHFNYIVSGLKKYQDQLNNRLSEVDMCICDLMHYLELYDLDDADYRKAAEMIKEYREKRRDIKDKIYIVDCFQKGLGTNNNLAKSKEALTLINKLEHRNYKPRVLTDIFTDTLIPTPKRKEQKEEVVEVPMESKVLERKETVFDGRENDWYDFVKKQAVFYGDVKQFAGNLQITLDELDGEIEQILHQIEDANCNVTQGYKVFKMLKDLRNERKRMAKELECVQTIVKCFDCDAMHHAYRYCEEEIAEIQEGSTLVNE